MSDLYDQYERAIRAGNEEIFSTISANAEVIQEIDSTGCTLLHLAVRHRRHRAAEALLQAGADPNVRNAWYLRTPLHYAALEADGLMVDVLIQKQAEVDAADAQAMTPLFWAPTNPLGEAVVEDVVTRLVEGGANIGAEDGVARTALHRAALEGSVGAVRALLRHGADPDPRDQMGVSPLHLAAGNGASRQEQAGYVEIVTLLLEAGADINAESTTPFLIQNTRHAARRTPLDVARRQRHREIIDLLTTRGGQLGPGRRRL